MPKTGVTILSALTGYFNEGAGKRPVAEWRQELKDLSLDERRALAEGVVKITGDTLA